MNTDLFPICGWCPPNSPPATVTITWTHEAGGEPDANGLGGPCWCEAGGRPPSPHVSKTCPEHVERDLRDLAELGLTVLHTRPAATG